MQPGSFRLPSLAGKFEMFLNAVCAFAESETGCETAQFSVRWSEVRVFHPGTHTKAVPSGCHGAAVMLSRRSCLVSSCAFSSPVFGGRPPSTSDCRRRRSRSSGLCCYTKPPVTYHHPPTPPHPSPPSASHPLHCLGSGVAFPGGTRAHAINLERRAFPWAGLGDVTHHRHEI